MQLLVTGAAGMLGHDVCQAARAAGHQVTPLAHADLDVADAEAVRQAIAAARPEAVINCAAFTDVDGAEASPDLAQRVNGEGPGHVAAAAAEAGAWTIHVSTDYVFDGTASRPYVESDATGPRSQYGRSKLAGEEAVARAAPGRHTIVRTAWLFGVAGACFPATILRLASERGELPVVADQVGCPTFTGDLGPALVALAESRPLGLLHVVGAGRCSWHEFAVEVLRAAGLTTVVRPVTAAEFPRPAPRPAWSVLGTERPEVAPRLPHWRRGLEDYMRTRT